MGRERSEAVHSLPHDLVRIAGRIHVHWLAPALRAGWPAFDVLVRIWIAHSCATLQMRAGAGSLWRSLLDALLAARHDAALDAGAIVALLAALLLTVGMFTRLSAVVLAIFGCLHLGTVEPALFAITTVLLAWYVIAGAGAFSLDALLGGLLHSALPFARDAARLAAWAQRAIVPHYPLALRLWLALALVAAGRFAPLPSLMVPHVSGATAIVLALLLFAGFGTRLLAALLALGIGAMSMMDPRDTSSFYAAVAFGLLVFRGAGPASFDAWLLRRFERRYPEEVGAAPAGLGSLPRVVVVGAGFGGLTCAAALRRAPVAVTLIDRTNHHLFQPLLYQVATGSLSPADVAAPIREQFRAAPNTDVIFGTVDAVDTTRRTVHVSDRTIPYDYLVLATGATHAYFGKDQWQPFAPGLKRVEDAIEIRRRLRRRSSGRKAPRIRRNARHC